MASLSTGFIIVGAYADKLRRTLFAQLSDKLRNKVIDPKEVARAAAEANQFLFDTLVNGLGLDKGDVVRIRMDFEIEDSHIKWNYDSLRIDAFRRVSEEEIKELIRKKIEASQ